VHVARFQLMTLIGGHRRERIVEGIRNTALRKLPLRLGAQLYQVLQSRGREAD
jgi:hypothetical protein